MGVCILAVVFALMVVARRAGAVEIVAPKDGDVVPMST